MTKAQKSSRKRMASRLRGKKKQSPGYEYVIDRIKGSVEIPNRPQVRLDRSWKKHAVGRSRRQDAKDKRRSAQTRSRRVLRIIRKETRRAMKRIAVRG